MKQKFRGWYWCPLQAMVVAACLIGSIDGALKPVARGDSPLYVEKSNRHITVGLDFRRLLKRSNHTPTNKLASATSQSGMIENSSSPTSAVNERANAIAGTQAKPNPTNSLSAVVVQRSAEPRPVVISGAAAGPVKVPDPYRQQRMDDAVHAANQQMRENQSAIVRGISNGADQGATGVFHPF